MNAQHVQHKLEVWDGTSLKAWCTAGRQTVAECYIEYRDGDGKVNGCNQSKPWAEANARRLAACWNACADVDTVVLEEHPRPFSSLREERDELQKALAFAVRFWDQLTPADAERMRAVLSKVTGSAS